MVSKHLKSLLDSLVTWSYLFLHVFTLVLVNQCPSICLTGDILSYLTLLNLQTEDWLGFFCLYQLKYSTFLFVEVVCVIETDFFFFLEDLKFSNVSPDLEPALWEQY